MMPSKGIAYRASSASAARADDTSLAPSTLRRRLKRTHFNAKLVRIGWPLLPLGLLFLVFRWRYLNAQHEASLRSFVKFSSYRIGGGEFVAIGLSPLEKRGRTKFRGCSWKDMGGSSWDRPIHGRLKPHFPGEHHNLQYEAIILKCKLRHATSGNKGGKLYMDIDDKTILVYEEEPDAFPSSLEPQAPYKYHVTFCSPSVHSAIDAKRIYEWIEYHHFLGIDLFILYDAGGITDAVLQTLLPYETQILEVRELGETLEYESWLYGQVMIINDCAYSTRYLSKWTIFFDLDEYFNADDPPPPEIKQAQFEAKQQEVLAAQHWNKQLEKLQRRQHKDALLQGRQEKKKLLEKISGKVGRLEDGEGEGGPYEPLPHQKKFSLEEKQQREISETEEKKAVAIQERQERQYLKLRKKKKTTSVWEKKLSAKELRKQLEERMKEQKEQMEVLKAYRQQLRDHSKKEKLIPLVLDSYNGAAFLTFGTLWWDVERCVLETEARGDWAVQRMLYHWPHIYCTKPEVYPRAEACLDYHGHRKYAIDPRKITALQIHIPVLNDSFGHDLDTTIAKMNHFQGLIHLKANTCTTIVKLRDELVWWARGKEISDIARAAQRSPKVRFPGLKYPEELSAMRTSR